MGWNGRRPSSRSRREGFIPQPFPPYKNSLGASGSECENQKQPPASARPATACGMGWTVGGGGDPAVMGWNGRRPSSRFQREGFILQPFPPYKNSLGASGSECENQKQPPASARPATACGMGWTVGGGGDPAVMGLERSQTFQPLPAGRFHSSTIPVRPKYSASWHPQPDSNRCHAPHSAICVFPRKNDILKCG